MSNKGHAVECSIGTHSQSDKYSSHYRRWGSSEGEDVVVMLHGGVSHSAWQAPLAEAVVSSSRLSFIALDRRGSGLNDQARGHLVSDAREIEDVGSFVQSVAGSFDRVHLAGWCFGAQVASIAAAHLAGRELISSLILVAPGFVYTERYGDVLRLSIQAVSEVVRELDLHPDPMRAFVPVPLQPSDFTESEAWLEFINEDKLRLTKVTQNTVEVWAKLAERSMQALCELDGLPVLAVFADRDRLVDNQRVKALLRERVHPAPSIESMDAHHAAHFDNPRALAATVIGFVSQLQRRRAATTGRTSTTGPVSGSVA